MTQYELNQMLGFDGDVIESDGLEESDFFLFDEYLSRRMSMVAQYGNGDTAQYYFALMFETLRAISLTLINIHNELERGHDNITKAIKEGDKYV